MDIFDIVYFVAMIIVGIFCGVMLYRVNRNIEAFDKSMEEFDKEREKMSQELERLAKRYSNKDVTDDVWRR